MLFSRVLLPLIFALPCAAAPLAQHVVIIGVDGMTAKSVEIAQTPNMHALMQSGAYTLSAHSIMPTVSSPNWASMLMGSEPETHGVRDNDWQPDKNNRFPTMFTALRAAEPDAVILVVYEWLDFRRLYNSKEITKQASCLKGLMQGDTSEYGAARSVAQQAAQLIQERKPRLTFIHLDMVDHAGHAHIYDSPEYNEAVGEADRLIGQIVTSVDDAGIRESTAIFVVSDHGGKDKSHGGDTPEEKTVPWIVSGAGIAQGATLPGDICVSQLAPTVIALLGVEAPKAWTAAPVSQALKQ